MSAQPSDDAVAVVTGGGRGMGRAVARRLARRGWTVVVTDIDETAAKDTAEQLGGRSVAMKHDVRHAAEHHTVAERAAELGLLTVWVNNAGVLRTGTLWEQDDAIVRSTVDVNLLGVMHGTRAALDVMRAHGRPADIINMASMSAFGPLPGLAVYAATKAGVLSWTLTTAAELHQAGSPVRVHAVCPDGVKTDMVAENADDSGSAMIFSGALLEPGAVADEIVALLGSRRIVRTLPRRRAMAARLSGFAPALTLPLLRAAMAAGERNRRKSLRT